MNSISMIFYFLTCGLHTQKESPKNTFINDSTQWLSPATIANHSDKQNNGYRRQSNGSNKSKKPPLASPIIIIIIYPKASQQIDLVMRVSLGDEMKVVRSCLNDYTIYIGKGDGALSK